MGIKCIILYIFFLFSTIKIKKKRELTTDVVIERWTHDYINCFWGRVAQVATRYWVGTDFARQDELGIRYLAYFEFLCIY